MKIVKKIWLVLNLDETLGQHIFQTDFLYLKKIKEIFSTLVFGAILINPITDFINKFLKYYISKFMHTYEISGCFFNNFSIK
jgi:hypothetical protein